MFQTIFNSLGTPDNSIDRYRRLYIAICTTLRQQWNWNLNFEVQFPPAIEEITLTCKWFEFYEICQVAYIFIKSLEEKGTFDIDSNSFEYNLNALLKDEFLGFEIRDGDIERLGNPITDSRIKEVRVILREPEFKSADELFQKSIREFNIRPNPDVENCIKDAVAAIESVGKIIKNDEKGEIDDIIKDAVKKGIIPPPLDQTIIKLHAYRGNEPAVAHGGMEPSKVTIDEAEFVLAMSAAIIIYLVKKKEKF